jgi:predicted HAD superfamily phosphohydrolase YqeG
MVELTSRLFCSLKLKMQIQFAMVISNHNLDLHEFLVQVDSRHSVENLCTFLAKPSKTSIRILSISNELDERVFLFHQKTKIQFHHN